MFRGKNLPEHEWNIYQFGPRNKLRQENSQVAARIGKCANDVSVNSSQMVQGCGVVKTTIKDDRISLLPHKKRCLLLQGKEKWKMYGNLMWPLHRRRRSL